MACNDAESESKGSNQLPSTLMEFTSNDYKNNLSAQYDTRSIMSGLTNGFKRMRESVNATAAEKATNSPTFELFFNLRTSGNSYLCQL